MPSLAAELHDVRDRIVDLLPVVRDHVYHPEFHGSFRDDLLRYCAMDTRAMVDVHRKLREMAG